MKLDLDCIRDILFTVEETATLSKPCSINHKYKDYRLLSKYEEGVLKYHVRQCALSGYFMKAECDFEFNYIILDLSPKGHEYIAAIRSDNIWKKAKDIIAKIGGVALSAVPDVVKPILESQVQKYLNGG